MSDIEKGVNGTKSRSITPRRSVSRSRSRGRFDRRSRSRSNSRSRSRTPKKARQPCVFYFSKEAKGCKFSGRDCKFSHDKYDYDNWHKDGKDLPNTGLIFRETPIYADRNKRRSRSRQRSRSYSPRRGRSRSYNRSPTPKKRLRERSFTLSPVRDGGYQPQGFSRTTRGFVNIPPEHVDKYVIDSRDLKKRRLVYFGKKIYLKKLLRFLYVDLYVDSIRHLLSKALFVPYIIILQSIFIHTYSPALLLPAFHNFDFMGFLGPVPIKTQGRPHVEVCPDQFRKEKN